MVIGQVFHIVTAQFVAVANPGDQVNKFMAVIAKQSYFHAMLDKTNAVLLTSPPSAPLTDGSKPYVLFELECHYPDQVR